MMLPKATLRHDDISSFIRCAAPLGTRPGASAVSIALVRRRRPES